MKRVIPILLAGGGGSRLWPLSRQLFPKQFSKLFGEKSLFQQAAQRIESSEVLIFDPPVIITNTKCRFTVNQQLKGIGINSGSVLIEPEAKNTAPAIMAACLFALKEDSEAVILVIPTDHFISDTLALHSAINTGVKKAEEGGVVLFGIPPSRPETGYGYVRVGSDCNAGVFSVVDFVEKPEHTVAQKMCLQADYFWNSGIFLFKAENMVRMFDEHAPSIAAKVRGAIEHSNWDMGFLRLCGEAWGSLDAISIDYAIIEKTKDLSLVPLLSDWSDLGDWNSVWEKSNKGPDQLSLSANSHAFDCHGSLIHSEGDNQQVVGLGLENIIVVAMQDAVLVANKDRTQELKGVVDHLAKLKLAQATAFTKDYRPWGWFESLLISDQYQVKRIVLDIGAAISLQSHEHRSEHWIFVGGQAEVTIDGTKKVFSAGESVFVPTGSVHRLSNPFDLPAMLIEVQIGTYLGEDDIKRYEDLYGRSVED